MREVAARRWLAAVVGTMAALAMAPVAALSAGSAGPTALAAPVSRQRLVLHDVHTDTVDVRLTDGALTLQSRVGSPPYEFFAAPDVLFQLKDVDSSRFQVPDDPLFAFLGAPGDPIWLAPQTQDPALLFAGWDTEGIDPGVLLGDVVDLSLVDVAGPGRVEVFEIGPTGEPLRNFSGTDAAFRTLHQPVASHVHGNWVFSALGRYRLTFEARAVAANGTAIPPVRATYTWYVGGAEPGDVVADPTTTGLSVDPASPSAGTPVVLSASVSPAFATGWIEFFDGSTSLGFAAVTAGEAELSAGLSGGTHTLTASYTPTYSNDHLPSTSAPVTVVVQGAGGGPTTSASPSASPSGSPHPSPTLTATSSPTASPGPSVTHSPASHSPPVCVPVTRTSTQTTTTTETILAQGHVDYAVRLTGGRVLSQIKDGTVAGRTAWRDPSDVVFHLVPAAATTVPASGYAFLGPSGSTIWQIPQTQRPGILWFGWNTEEIRSSQIRGGIVWSLDKVEGPGRLSVYLFTAFGQPQIVFHSGDGLPDRYTIPVGTHAHGNWAFSRPGVYRITFSHTATLTDGRRVRDIAVVTFAVGDTDPRPLARHTATRVVTSRGTSCDGNLAVTGTSTIRPLLFVGAGLLLLGVFAVLVARRPWRRTR